MLTLKPGVGSSFLETKELLNNSETKIVRQLLSIPTYQSFIEHVLYARHIIDTARDAHVNFKKYFSFKFQQSHCKKQMYTQ